ncbi:MULTISPECIES: caspase domain-containing protein [unclassified Leptolyngbya]|uniref:caspase family protein n=1 Tax=unclassified Leptolyngbya TaxID=2650499 RepID=UPI001687C036|nr:MULTISPECIES: caspase domain-containing protein [unclassified Leptolyngbya]MBD1910033.1 caspase family protein [Leptolyngbya sp. FACHB-8]MBD2157159.1 caspase family protein [Leptolyngbya sp. FACHB-16]
MMLSRYLHSFLLGLAISTFSVAILKLSLPVRANERAPNTADVNIEFGNTNTDRYSTGRRVALIIGNANYRIGGQLRNPLNDAQDMERALRGLGFETILVTDATLREMEESLNEFSSAIRQGSVGIFYYAGHGVQSAGENYLIPVNAQIEVEQDLRYEALAVGQVIGRMEAAENDANILILDACRDNPLARRWRSSQQGLTAITTSTAEGIFIAYATAPGDVADDGAGRNGTFTGALLRHIRTPGQQLEQLFNVVRAEVRDQTNGEQVPWTASSLIGNFAFLPEPGQSQVTPASPISAPLAPITNVTPRRLPCAGSVCEGLPSP